VSLVGVGAGRIGEAETELGDERQPITWVSMTENEEVAARRLGASVADPGAGATAGGEFWQLEPRPHCLVK